MRIIPSNRDALVAFAQRAGDGAQALEADVKLAQNTSARITVDLHDLMGEPGSSTNIGKQGIYNQMSAQLTDARAARLQMIEAGRKLCATAVDLLKSHFGRVWSVAWEAAGFSRNSIAISSTHVAPVLLELRNYFRANPQHEVGSLGVTSVALDAAVDAIRVAEYARNSALSAFRDARDARDAATKKLKSRLSGLREELNRLLSRDDHRWAAFGFSRPIDGPMPERVKEVTVTPALPGNAIVQWKAAPRAVNYRVRWKPLTEGADFTDAGLFTNRAVNLSGLPTGTTITVQVTARNRAGETLPTVVEVGVT